MQAEATDTDQSAVLDRARGGDVRAFERLYRELSPRVYGVCLRLAKDTAEAQDCTQDTFVTAWRKLAEFRGDSAFGTWLHRIAVNEVLARRRRESTETRYLTAVSSEPRRAASDPATLEDLERAIAKLPERARDVFVLRAVYGHTHDEIATLLAVTVSTSKTQYLRARRLLMAALPGVRDGGADGGAVRLGDERGGDAAELAE
jgi:RNA polymerase sigma-70 factor, ECF subfamily